MTNAAKWQLGNYADVINIIAKVKTWWKLFNSIDNIAV